jgi:hypothetical protein
MRKAAGAEDLEYAPRPLALARTPAGVKARPRVEIPELGAEDELTLGTAPQPVAELEEDVGLSLSAVSDIPVEDTSDNEDLTLGSAPTAPMDGAVGDWLLGLSEAES